MTGSRSLNDLLSEYPSSYLLKYIEQCQSGEILIGQELLMEFDILLAHYDDQKSGLRWTTRTSVLSL